MIAGKSFIVIAFSELPPTYPDICGFGYIPGYGPALALGGSVSDINGHGNGPEARKIFTCIFRHGL